MDLLKDTPTPEPPTVETDPVQTEPDDSEPERAWECTECTLKNSSSNVECDACHSPNPFIVLPETDENPTSLEDVEVGAAPAPPRRRHSYIYTIGPQAAIDLKAHERTRRRQFTKQLHQNELYWKAMMELAERSRVNNLRTISYLKEKATVDHAYAESLVQLPTAVYKDDAKKKKEKSDDPDGPKKIVASSQVLGELFELQSRAGQAHTEFSAWIQEELVQKMLGPMTSKFIVETDAIYAEGKKCVQAHLDKEAQVQKIYDAFEKISGRLLQQENEAEDAKLEASKKISFITQKETLLDMWLADMHYRSSVTQQQSSWEEGGKTLSRLFSKVKELERERRENMQSCLQKFAERQVELWSKLGPLAGPLMGTLSNIILDKNGIDGEINQSIRIIAMEIEKKEGKDTSESTTLATEGDPNATTTTEPSGPLASPMLSPLLKKAGILSKKSTGLMTKWKPYLAVATVDAHLHLFEIPKGTSLPATGADAEQAYSLVMASVQSLDLIMSTTTIQLDYCESCEPCGKDAMGFELVENKPVHGMKKVFKANERNKFVFRALGTDDLNEWLVVLKTVQLT